MENNCYSCIYFNKYTCRCSSYYQSTASNNIKECKNYIKNLSYNYETTITNNSAYCPVCKCYTNFQSVVFNGRNYRLCDSCESMIKISYPIVYPSKITLTDSTESLGE